jgi:hypothetical protein
MMRRTYQLLALALLILPLSVQAAETMSQVVVIKSNADPFLPGRTISATEMLSLSAGEHITAVASNGQVIKVTGPYSGTIGMPPDPAESGSIVRMIANLIKTESADRNTLAVTRQWQAERMPPDPWVVSIASQGPHCVLATQPVSIWRGNAEKESSIRLSRSSNGPFADSRWPKGAYSTPWPSSIEIASGQTYRARIDGSQEAVFDIFVAPRELPTTVHRVVWLAEHGCRRQARMLLDQAAAEH